MFFKAVALCKRVLSVAFACELMQELRGKAFSLLIGETTEQTRWKLVTVLVRHWDLRSAKMVDDLLGIVEVDARGGGRIQAVEGEVPVLYIE